MGKNKTLLKTTAQRLMTFAAISTLAFLLGACKPKAANEVLSEVLYPTPQPTPEPIATPDPFATHSTPTPIPLLLDPAALYNPNLLTALAEPTSRANPSPTQTSSPAPTDTATLAQGSSQINRAQFTVDGQTVKIELENDTQKIPFFNRGTAPANSTRDTSYCVWIATVPVPGNDHTERSSLFVHLLTKNLARSGGTPDPQTTKEIRLYLPHFSGNENDKYDIQLSYNRLNSGQYAWRSNYGSIDVTTPGIFASRYSTPGGVPFHQAEAFLERAVTEITLCRLKGKAANGRVDIAFNCHGLNRVGLGSGVPKNYTRLFALDLSGQISCRYKRILGPEQPSLH